MQTVTLRPLEEVTTKATEFAKIEPTNEDFKYMLQRLKKTAKQLYMIIPIV